MKKLDMLAYLLVLVGGLNWGLVGAFDFNLVSMLLGAGTIFSTVVYCLVGLSSVWLLLGCKGVKKRWGIKCCSEESCCTDDGSCKE